MKLVVGLGNPGRRYYNTRHNVGYRVVDRLAGHLGAGPWRARDQAEYVEVRFEGQGITLLKPTTYMNLSGLAVAAAARNRIEGAHELLVVMDDANLPLGRLRLRAEGSAGGHNGLRSIIERLGTSEFPRLRIGIGENKMEADLTPYVLGKFVPEEKARVEKMLDRAVDAILAILREGLGKAMTEFNAPPKPEED
ncbi:MAG: aminoacyl-tRNA hydrolase [Candidatus Hydrogenedentes bacterium]|nr:aminoacyl-tRNA hydrolase [Candidatus Hydrogenedentota bacterium]